MTEEILEMRIDSLEDQVERLQKKLDIATKALEGIRVVWKNNPKLLSYIAIVANRKAKQALKEMEEV